MDNAARLRISDNLSVREKIRKYYDLYDKLSDERRELVTILYAFNESSDDSESDSSDSDDEED